MILIISTIRSGSTWLGKIFDSHPDVLYLHEPDIADRGHELLPVWFKDAPTESDAEAARTYFNRLVSARTVRAVGIRPFFRKNYRGHTSELSRRSLLYLAKGSERVGLQDGVASMSVPDFSRNGAKFQCVIKSVSAHGRAEALIKGLGAAITPILLLRHPCAIISSVFRGIRLGHFGSPQPLGELLETRSARRLGADIASLANASDVEKMAWSWLISNAEAHDAIQAVKGQTVIYRDLVNDPVAELKRLFEQTGLAWVQETEAFLRNSAKRDGPYFSVFRDPKSTLNRWRTELDSETIGRIREVVTRHPIGRLFFCD